MFKAISSAIIAAAALVFSQGCAVNSEVQTMQEQLSCDGVDRQVVISNTYSADHVDAILSALEAWEGALGGAVKFHPEVGEAKNEFQKCAYVFVDGSPSQGAAAAGEAITMHNLNGVGTGSGVSYILNDDPSIPEARRSVTRFQQVATHEIGHLLGVDHLPGEIGGELPTMFWTIHSQMHNLTDADVQAACEVWSCK